MTDGAGRSPVRAGDVVAAITLVVALLIAGDASEWLRGGFGWRWQYELVSLSRLLPLIAVTAVYIAGVWLIQRRGMPIGWLLAWAILGGVVLAWAGVGARHMDVPAEMFARTASLLGTGQQWAAVHTDWMGGEWRMWTEVMARLGGHMSNVPPGAPLTYAALGDLLDRVPAFAVPVQRWLIGYQCNNYDLLGYTAGQWASSLFGMLMPLWAALTVIPLYVVGRRFVGAAARHAVIWWVLVPALIGFAGSWSTLYPLFAVVIFGLLAAGLESERGRRFAALIALSGLLFGLGVFVNFALIPLALLLGLYTLGLILLVQRRGFARALVADAIFGVGMIVPWLIFWLLGGQSFFEMLTTSMQFHLSLDRPYWFWVGMHLWDWWLWTGVGFALLSLIYVWRWWQRRVWDRLALLTLVLTLTMLILIFSGTARGETGRVWLFFTPLLLIAAAGALAELPKPRWGWLTAAQAVYLIALVASLDAVGTDFQPPPASPQVVTTQPADATFAADDGTLFRLVGWGAEVDADTIRLNLNWQALDTPLIPYWFGAVLIAPDGTTYGIDAWQPDDQRYPTTCWRSDTVIGDTIAITLPDGVPSGDWWISLAAYPGDAANVQLEVLQPGQPADHQVGLGPISVDQP